MGRTDRKRERQEYIERDENNSDREKIGERESEKVKEKQRQRGRQTERE